MTSDGQPTSVAVIALGRPTFDLTLGADRVIEALDVLERSVATVEGAEMLRQAIIDGAGIVLDDHALSIDDTIDAARRGDADAIVVLQATFADARTVIALAERSGVPVVVWSFPEDRTGERLRLNSLCGANLAAYSLRRRHHPAAFVHLDPTDADASARLRHTFSTIRSEPTEPQQLASTVDGAADCRATARRVIDGLADTVVGVVGDPPDGFEPCSGDAAEIRSTLGVRVEHQRLDSLFSAANHATADTVAAVTERIRRTLDVCPGVTEQGMNESVRLYAGLRAIGSARGWGALSTRCWPECMTEFGGAVCTPQAMLTEDGVPAVCEADVLGSITALMLQRLTGTDPFIADLVDVDPTDNTSVLWHCGVASSNLAAGHREGVLHPNRQKALVSQFALKPGRVTVARLSQSGCANHGFQMVIGAGEMLDRPRSFSGTSGVIRWDRPATSVIGTVLDAGIEHHLGVAYGDHREHLVAIAGEWGLPVVELGVERR